MWRNWDPGALLVGASNGSAAVETVWRFHRMLEQSYHVTQHLPLWINSPKN